MLRQITMVMLLMGCLSAQTTLTGYVWGGANWHKVYVSDDGLLIVEALANKTVGVYGTYTPMSDKSPGYITIMKQEWGAMARVLAHELCHARQDDEHRLQNEKECGQYG